MPLLNGHVLGTWSLRLDAGYCAVLGVIIAVTAPHLTMSIALPMPLLVAIGVIVAVWAGLALWMLARLSLRRALLLVLGVNTVATVLISVAAFGVASADAMIPVLAIALSVALFAVSQAVALRAPDLGRQQTT